MMWFPWIMVALVAVEGIVITWLVRIHEGRWERREAELKAELSELRGLSQEVVDWHFSGSSLSDARVHLSVTALQDWLKHNEEA